VSSPAGLAPPVHPSRALESSPANFLTIQALRAVAALLVVLLHAFETWGERVDSTAPGVNWENGAAGVDIFFIISGFVMVISSQRLVDRPGAWRTFLQHRVIRIVPLYWLLTTVKILAVLALGGVVLRTGLDFNFVAGSYLFLPVTDRRPGSYAHGSLAQLDHLVRHDCCGIRVRSSSRKMDPAGLSPSADDCRRTGARRIGVDHNPSNGFREYESSHLGNTRVCHCRGRCLTGAVCRVGAAPLAIVVGRRIVLDLSQPWIRTPCTRSSGRQVRFVRPIDGRPYDNSMPLAQRLHWMDRFYLDRISDVARSPARQ
jgi:hypothetical protein